MNYLEKVIYHSSTKMLSYLNLMSLFSLFLHDKIHVYWNQLWNFLMAIIDRIQQEESNLPIMLSAKDSFSEASGKNEY